MLRKKIFALVFVLILIFLLNACGAKNENFSSEKTTLPEMTVISDEVDVLLETTIQAVLALNEQSTGVNEVSTSTVEQISKTTVDEFTKAEIIEIYKNAALKSNNIVKSKQDIYLKNISINNGEFEKVMNFVTPIMAKLLSNNSKEIDGITGGYSQLTEADVLSAKLYSVGNNTALELIIKSQVGGARDNLHEGSVGHAINTVGDIGVVTDQLKDLGLPMEINDDNTLIHYTNPTVKVIVDPNGYIISGTWQYTVDIRLMNYKVFGKPVNNTSVVMDNVITVNGGFEN